MSAEQLLAEKDAEIERLRSQLVIASELVRCLQEDFQNEWRPLITEMADALSWYIEETDDDDGLIHRAREASKMSNLRTDHEIEIDNLHDRQLKAVIQAQKIHCEGQSTEIERLKQEIETLKGAVASLGAICQEKNRLITELCDALEEQSCWSTKVELTQRAREATR